MKIQKKFSAHKSFCLQYLFMISIGNWYMSTEYNKLYYLYYSMAHFIYFRRVSESGYIALFQLEFVNQVSVAAFMFHQITVSPCFLYLPIIQQQHPIAKLQILQTQKREAAEDIG